MLEDRGEKAPARETKMTRFHFCLLERIWYGGSASVIDEAAETSNEGSFESTMVILYRWLLAKSD